MGHDDDSNDDDRRSRHLTPHGGVDLLDTEVTILKGLVKRHEDELTEHETWVQEHRVYHARRDAILHGDDKNPGQLDRMESTMRLQNQQMADHFSADERYQKGVEVRVSKMEKIHWKILISSSVGATFAVLAWRFAELVGLIHH